MRNPLRNVSRTWSGVTAVAVTAVAGLALSGVAVATTNGPTHPNHTHPTTTTEAAANTKPTVVFVHGAWADSSGWNAEVAALQEEGYPVIAAANPMRGLTSDADYVRSIVQTIPGPVVLVAHSYGGAVITNAARGASNVKALVYVAGFALDAGESVAQLATKNPGSEITPDALIERPYPLADGGTGVDLYIKASYFHDAFAGDLPLKTTRVMQAEQRPMSVAAFTEASGEPAWKTIPSWYLVTTQDKAIPPATQLFMAKRAGADITKTESSHVAMISRPKVTTNVILDALHAVD